MARYRIRKPTITKLALVKRGANHRTVALLKSAATEPLVHEAPLLKTAGDDWRRAWFVVMVPGAVEDGGIRRDGTPVADTEDVWEPAEIELAKRSFDENGGLVTGAHFIDEKYGHATDSFIAPVDFQLGDELVKAGSWVVGIEPTAEGRVAINTGDVQAVSIEGTGIRELIAHAGPAPFTAKHPPVPHSAGTNWVDKTGGLPGAIDAIYRALVARGMPKDVAAPSAISQAEKMCATGFAAGGKIKLGAPARATICAAVAEFQAKAKASRAATVAKAGVVPMSGPARVGLALSRLELAKTAAMKPLAKTGGCSDCDVQRVRAARARAARR